MKKIIAAALLALFPALAIAQTTPTRMPPQSSTAGYPTTTTDGNRVLVQAVVPSSANGAANPAGTASDPLFVNAGGNTGDVTGTGTLALATANAAVTIPLAGGRNAVGLTINGLTGSGATITVERSNDGGTTWTNANTTESSATSSLSSTITANGQARVGVAGATNIRLRVSTAGTGTATIAYNATTAAGPVFLTSALPSYSTPDGRIIGGVDNRFINGVTVSTGLNPADGGTQRVALSTDSLARGRYNTTLPAGVAGSPLDLQTDYYGSLRSLMIAGTQPGSDNVGRAQNLGATFTGATPDGAPRPFNVAPFYVNEAGNQDQVRGNTTGAFVIAKGSATLATGQVSVGTTATLIRAADTGRTSITVIVGSATACAFGNAGVTLTTGYLLPATAGATDTTATSAALYAVCSATATISYKAILP